jgi:phospholipid/cholesterol/gamma-HCH transport system substrate-binding protein
MKAAHNNKRAVTVGIFIFLGIAIFVIAVLTLGGQQKTFSKALTVKAVFDDVQGLQKGNNIWFSGVKIGTIKKISFHGNSQVEVELNIQESSKDYIRKDAMAKISSDGFIGSKLVVLYGGTDKAQPVENGDVLRVEKIATTDEMFSTLQGNNRNLLDITNDFKVISKRLTNGEGAVGKLLTDESLVTELQAVMASLRRASQNTERLTNTVSGYAAQLNNKGTLANDLVTDTVLYARLRATTLQVQQVSETADAVINDLKQASNSLNAGITDKTTPVGMLLNDRAAAADIRTTLKYLNTSSRKLDENLEALQHNFLLRGFFKKKAKRAETDSVEIIITEH